MYSPVLGVYMILYDLVCLQPLGEVTEARRAKGYHSARTN
jgi:hypothetical protein